MGDVRVVWVDGGEQSVRELHAAVAYALDGGPAVLPLSTREPAARALRDAMRPDMPAEPGTALVIATSGSTGTPKGVLLSADALTVSARATHARLGGDGSWLLATPPQYIGGMQVLVRSILAGNEPAVVDLSDGFRAEAFTDGARAALERPGRHYTALVPTQLTRLLDAGGAAVSTLREFDAVLLGGAETPAELRERAEGAGVRVVSAYGSSETSGGCVYDGATLDGVRVRLDIEGRILLSGGVLTHGYRLDPAGTAAVLRDGWFHTSDLGRFTVDGRLEVLGRADDVIITGGVKVAARSVRSALVEHPDVRDACVIGLPHPEWGQAVAAAVTPADPSTPPDPAELTQFARERLGSVAAPKAIRVVRELPLRGPGKVDLAGVRALFGPREK